LTYFVGCTRLEFIDEHIGVTVPMVVMYSTEIPSRMEQIGPYTMDISMDAEPRVTGFPLVMISHGSGGSNLAYRTLAHYLACNGFIVCMLEHPFNNRNDNNWADTTDNLTNRPRHIRMAMKWLQRSSKFSRYMMGRTFAIIGHSMGGYTALAVAGGWPSSFPHESPDGQSQKISVTPDEWVYGLVLLAPAAVWFKEEGALSTVGIPILMLVGEKDEYTPFDVHGRLILDRVPDASKVQYRIIENGGHFSFLSPFPESMASAAFAPSQDPPGFDRARFHKDMNAEILDFLMREVVGKPLRLCNKAYPCACCGHMAFERQPGSYDVCPICWWEDDEVQLRPNWWNFGGPNKPIRVAQWKYQRRGQLPPDAVWEREPIEGDVRDPDWYPLPEEAPVEALSAKAPSGREYFDALGEEETDEGYPYYWRWTEDLKPPRPATFR